MNWVKTTGYVNNHFRHITRSDDILPVRCPDCGTGGGSSYPCVCHRCHEDRDSKVLMLPIVNGVLMNWNEVFKTCQ